MRGKGHFLSGTEMEAGITPAYAGKRDLLFLSAEYDEDHPCVCGEKVYTEDYWAISEGSPLRMRGKGLVQT